MNNVHPPTLRPEADGGVLPPAAARCAPCWHLEESDAGPATAARVGLTTSKHIPMYRAEDLLQLTAQRFDSLLRSRLTEMWYQMWQVGRGV
jgi:hypothetical protein